MEEFVLSVVDVVVFALNLGQDLLPLPDEIEALLMVSSKLFGDLIKFELGDLGVCNLQLLADHCLKSKHTVASNSELCFIT